MNLTIDELEDACIRAGLSPETEEKSKRKALARRLGDFYFNRDHEGDENLRLRRLVDSPMLCFRFDKLREDQKKEVMTSPQWGAEHKYNGARCLLVHKQGKSLRAYSRHLSRVDFLPVDFTSGILVRKKRGELFPLDFETVQEHIENIPDFIVDCEIEATGNIDSSDVVTSGGMTESELNATVALLNMEPTKAWKIQQEQGVQLQFRIFDCLYFSGHWLLEVPLSDRKKFVSLVGKLLRKKFDKGYFRVGPIFTSRKERFLERLWLRKGEGIVLKNLENGYRADDGRGRDYQIKLKRSMSGEMEKDVDAFIIGINMGTEGSNFEGVAGSIDFGVWMEKDGGEVIHHIATVSGIPMELRKDLAEDFEKYRGRVYVIDGMSVSPKSLRLSHATVRWEQAWRPDKGPEECSISERDLRENII